MATKKQSHIYLNLFIASRVVINSGEAKNKNSYKFVNIGTTKQFETSNFTARRILVADLYKPEENIGLVQSIKNFIANTFVDSTFGKKTEKKKIPQVTDRMKRIDHIEKGTREMFRAMLGGKVQKVERKKFPQVGVETTIKSDRIVNGISNRVKSIY